MVSKFYYLLGGTEKYYFDLMRLMEQRGHQVIPFAMQHPQNHETPYSRYFVSQVDYEAQGWGDKARGAARIFYSLEARRKVARLLADTQPDLAHLQHLYHQLSSSILYPLQAAGIPVVQSVHDYKLVCPNYRLFNPSTGQVCYKCRGHHYYRAFLERCHKGSAVAGLLICLEAYQNLITGVYRRLVDRFVVSNEHMQSRLLEYGIEPRKVVVIPNFIEADEYIPSYENGGFILYFGRLIPEKGVDRLIEAMAELPDIQLKVVGSGDQIAALEACTLEAGLKNVQFLGPVWGEALKAILAQAQFVVVPSLWYDNSPMVIYQSFMMGKPVIGSRRGGIPSLIDDGKTGVLYEAEDVAALRAAIRHLFEHPELVRSMGQAARRKAEREYNAEVHYERVMAVYEDLLAERRCER